MKESTRWNLYSHATISSFCFFWLSSFFSRGNTHIHAVSYYYLLVSTPSCFFSFFSYGSIGLWKRRWNRENDLNNLFSRVSTREKTLEKKAETANHSTFSWDFQFVFLFSIKNPKNKNLKKEKVKKKNINCRGKILMIRFYMLFSSFLLLLPYYYHW